MRTVISSVAAHNEEIEMMKPGILVTGAFGNTG
jgi:hypothetical protein